MLLINLLPHREWARKKKRERFYASLLLAALLGLALAALVYAAFELQMTDQQQRNQMLQAEIKQLDAQIRDVATLQEEISALQSRQEAVQGLQAGRNQAVHLMVELVQQLPQGVHLTAVRQENLLVNLVGVAQSQERVSELLRNLNQRSQWLTQPTLVEITAATVELGPRDQRRVFNFTVRATLNQSEQAPRTDPATPAAAGQS